MFEVSPGILSPMAATRVGKEGMRPSIPAGTPELISKLISDCLHQVHPTKRFSALSMNRLPSWLFGRQVNLCLSPLQWAIRCSDNCNAPACFRIQGSAHQLVMYFAP